MIIEERIYFVQPGKAGEYVKLMESEGIAIQEPILGRLFGFFSTEAGPLNQIIHLWAYESWDERQQRRTELMKNEKWLAFLNKSRPLIVSQENKILIPASFSPPLRNK